MRSFCFSRTFRKSEKSASIVRDDSFSNIVNNPDVLAANKRLASAPPENNPLTPPSANQRRSRFDTNHSHEQSLSTNTNTMPDVMSTSVTAASTATTGDMGSSKNRFFSLSRRFRFRVQSPEKGTGTTSPASVHFLDEDIDLETKERTTRKSDHHGNRPSKGILKTLRHRSPFRFRSKDAVIPEQEPSPPPPPTPVIPPPSTAPPPPVPKETRSKIPPAAPTPTKQRGRLVELKKTTPKSSSSNGASRKEPATTTTTTAAPATSESTGSTLVRRTSGLKDLIHKFEITPSDRPPKPKRTGQDSIESTEQVKKSTSYSDLPVDDQQRASKLLSINKSDTIDIPDLLRNVEKDPSSPPTSGAAAKAILRHSNSTRQTTSFDSAASMVSASESIATTNSSTRRPTSTARPLMISLVSTIISLRFIECFSLTFFRAKTNHNVIDEIYILLSKLFQKSISVIIYISCLLFLSIAFWSK